MAGTSSTTFSPEVTTSRAMITTILWRMAGSPVVDYAMDYTDVGPAAWHGEAVRWATSQCVVTYRLWQRRQLPPLPQGNTTRAQLAVMLCRWLA